MMRIPRRLRGYHRAEVDAVLARIAGTLGTTEPRPSVPASSEQQAGQSGPPARKTGKHRFRKRRSGTPTPGGPTSGTPTSTSPISDPPTSDPPKSSAPDSQAPRTGASRTGASRTGASRTGAPPSNEPPPSPSPITAEEARVSRFRVGLRGYDRRIVDGMLIERIRELEAHERMDDYNARHARTRAPARFSPVSADWLIGWITTAQFGVVRIKAGYNEGDVDTFLARVVAGLHGDAPPVGGHDVRDSRFRIVRFRAGYAEREVDRFLDQLASALDGLSKG